MSWSNNELSLHNMGTPLVKALDFAIKSSKAKASSKKQYEHLVVGMDTELLLTPIEELQYNHVRLAILRDSEKDSEGTVYARYSFLRTQLKRIDRLQLYRLKDRRLVEQDFEVRKPARAQVRRVGTEAMYAALASGEPWGFLFAFGAATALRKSDLYNTKWSQLQGRQFRALHGKTEKVVDLELGELGLTAVHGLRKHKQGEYIVPLRNSRTVHTVDLQYRKFLKQYGLIPHDSRRLFCQLLLSKGAPINVVQRLGAWSDITMLMHYASSITDSEAARYRL